MAYSKVSTIATSTNTGDQAGGPHTAIKYFLSTFLPTVGWTVSVTDNSTANAPSAWNADHWYFVKKTLTFEDGTTDTISFVMELEWGSRDIAYHSWDGVLATNDSTDPQYGRGPTTQVIDTSCDALLGGTYDIWKDDNSDSWMHLRDGKVIGFWMPNGNWVRQDFPMPAGNQNLAAHPFLLPISDYSGMTWGGSTTNISCYCSRPVDNGALSKVTNFIELETGTNASTGSRTAMWRGASNDIAMRASYAQLDNTQSPTLLQIGSSAPYDYYYGPSDTSGDYGLYFNFGTTDPGY